MRKLIWMLLFAGPLAAQNYGSYSNAPVARPQFLRSPSAANGNVLSDSSLVGWWPLASATGPAASDMSGKGNHGAWSGTKAGTNGYWSSGKTGPWAGYFNGSNDYVDVPYASAFDTGTFTLVLWVYPTSFSSQSVYYPWSRWSASLGLALGIQGTYSTCGSGAAGYPYMLFNNTALCGTAALPLNKWSLLAAAYDGTTAALYVNGTLVNSAAETFTNQARDINIGRRSDGVWYFPGKITGVRFYNTAKAAGLIQTIYNTENR